MKKDANIKILYLEHEGGWGGASRSLWYLLKALNRDRFLPEVWHRQNGPAIQRFEVAGIAHRLVTDMPNLTAKSASHLGNWLVNFRRLLAMGSIAKKVIECKADIIHFNYEGLAPLAWSIRKLGDRRPLVLHVRSICPDSIFGRQFVKRLSPLFSHIIFITENERDGFFGNGFKGDDKYSVLYNPAPPKGIQADLNEDSTFRVSFFGTLDWLRGADRLIDVAVMLRGMGVNVQINLFGRAPRYRKYFIFERKEEDRLRSRIKEMGVEKIVSIKGHTADPEAEILRSHLVVRPSRGADPWGRDVIEAMSLGVPVLASGTYDRFIQTGRTGVLIEPWRTDLVADWIARLDVDRTLLRFMGNEAAYRAQRLFDPVGHARQVERVYEQLLGNRS